MAAPATLRAITPIVILPPSVSPGSSVGLSSALNNKAPLVSLSVKRDRSQDAVKYPHGFFSVAEPWDKLLGPQYDVFVHRQKLVVTVRSSKVQSWAPNCASFSRSREIPIPGALRRPLPLRSFEFPRGFPHLTGHPKARVDRDTEMADLAAIECHRALDSRCFFLLESPGNAYTWHLSLWISLGERDSVFDVLHHSCMFPDCTRRKFQRIRTNIKGLASVGLLCASKEICSRTGQPHESFAPVVSAEGRILSFPVRGESEYSAGLCSEQAKAIVETARGVPNRAGIRFDFVEIFCGPNYPLTKAVLEKAGVGSLVVRPDHQPVLVLARDVSSATSPPRP